jgi:hypothetical protein
MVYDLSGRRSAGTPDRVTFTANRARLDLLVVVRSPTRPLDDTVGVYRPGWAKLLAWNNRARTFRIIR